MSLKYWYVCHVNPVPWQIGPISGHRGKGGKGMYATVGRDEELHTYKEAIKEALRAQSPRMMTGDLVITCFFWRNRTESTSTKTGRAIKKSQADGTNMLKSTEDACQGILFDNDKSNVAGHWYIIDQGPDVAGQVVIAVETAGALFKDDALQLIPDDVYAKLALSKAEQLALGVAAPNAELATEDDEYSRADPIF